MDQIWLAKLEGDEGCRLKVYDDATGKPIGPGTHVIGHPTIGIGRCLDMHGISQDEATSMFATDVATVEHQLSAAFEFFAGLTPGRQFVLVSMAFNLGFGGLMGFPHMLAAIRAQDWATAKAQMLDSRAARELPGRYGRLADIMLAGQ